MVQVFAWIVALSFTASVWAIDPEIEVQYAEASLAFNSGDTKGAIALLLELLKTHPEDRELLELRALIIEKSYPPAEAIKAYEQLANLAFTKVWDRAVLGLYEYRLGYLYLQERKIKEARTHLENAIRYKANVGPAYFYIGMAEMHGTSTEKARAAFEKVLQSEAQDLKPLAHVQLAQLFRRNNDETNSIRSLLAARDSALSLTSKEDTPASQKRLASSVLDKVDKETRSFDRSMFIANIGLLTGYNSNVLSIPSTGLVSSGSENSASLQSIFQYSLGYVSPPLRTLQFLPTYSGSLNYNFNALVRDAQFFTNDLNLYITRNPMSITNMGLKLEGIGVMQLQTSGLSTYSLGGSLGPFFKYELRSKWAVGVDVFFEPQKNYLDGTVTAAQQKSGWGQTLRLFTTREERRVYWNPTLYLRGAWNQTAGVDFRSKAVTLGLDNAFFLDRSALVSIGGSLGYTLYDQATAGRRQDETLNLSVKGSYSLTPSLGIFGQLGYLYNLSSVSTNQYHQIQAMVGGNYSL